MNKERSMLLWFCIAIFTLLFATIMGCSQEEERLPLNVPRGYTQVIEIEQGDRLLTFGPFVGYYFSPATPDRLDRLNFICFNERSFYTRDLPENAMLFEGEAVLRNLEDVGFTIPADDRINPVMFTEAPKQWLAKRPKPQDQFVHFHSCYDSRGPELIGYWLKHIGKASFVYDMGGRVGKTSVLYHEVREGVDASFARLMEFDSGKALY